jgi:HK97 family phage portal protein
MEKPNFFQRIVKAIRNEPFTSVDASYAKNLELVDALKGATPNSTIALVRDSFGVNRDPSKPTVVDVAMPFTTLRRLRNTVPVVELCIAVIKKEVSQCPWDIIPLDDKKVNQKGIDEITKFLDFVNPQGENFRIFLDKLIDDLLTFDAGVAEKLRNLKGGLIGLDVVDATTIRPVLNSYGEFHPETAYVQVINKKTVAGFPKEDIIYLMQNPQNDVKRFGYGKSPIENIFFSITSMLNADTYNFKAFAEDNIPAGMLYIGENTPEKARAFKEYWEETSAGKYANLKIAYTSTGQAKPEFTKFGGTSKEMQFIEYIDWLSRIISAEYGISATELNIIKDVNRNTSKEEAAKTDSRGIRSIKTLIEEFLTKDVINHEFGYNDLTFSFIPYKGENIKTQAEVDKIYIEAGVTLPDEVRIREGKPTLSEMESILGVESEPDNLKVNEEDEDVKKSIEDSPVIYP